MNEAKGKWIITTKNDNKLIIEHNTIDGEILIDDTLLGENVSLITVKYNEVEIAIDEENKVNDDGNDRWLIEVVEWENLSITHKKTDVNLLLMLDEFEGNNSVSLTIRYKNSDISITKQKKIMKR